MYHIELDKSKELFIVKGFGLYKEDELLSFINDLKTKINLINPRDYKLVLDTSKLKTSGQKTLPIMNDIMQIYLETPFKKRFYVQSESVTANMQMKRTGKNDFFDNLTIISSIKESYTE